VSVLDPVVVALAAGRRARSIHYLVVADVFERPLIGRAMRALAQVPVRRGIGDRVAIERLTALVRAGSLGGVSVEGTVGDGVALQPGQKGAARVALAAGCPLIPVGIWGTQERWPRPGVRWGRPIRPVVVAIVGEPIALVGDARSRADVRDATDRLMDAIGRLVDAARGQQLPTASPAEGRARRAARV
jgi:1-acyl-sn-glycerol-3-phosphate acyltransferase